MSDKERLTKEEREQGRAHWRDCVVPSAIGTENEDTVRACATVIFLLLDNLDAAEAEIEHLRAALLSSSSSGISLDKVEEEVMGVLWDAMPYPTEADVAQYAKRVVARLQQKGE